MENNQTEEVNELIYNFITLQYPERQRVLLINIFNILIEMRKYDEIEDVLLDIVLKDELDTNTTIHDFNTKLSTYCFDLLESYGIKLIDGEITFKNIYTILTTLSETINYDILTYETTMNIIETDETDSIEKLGTLVEFFTEESKIEIYEYVDNVEHSLWNTITTHLEKAKHADIDDEDPERIAFINKVLTISPTILDTKLLKSILEVEEYEFDFRTYLSKALTDITTKSTDIRYCSLVLYALFSLSNEVENITYMLDSDILDDLQELQIPSAIAIIERTKLLIQQGVLDE